MPGLNWSLQQDQVQLVLLRSVKRSCACGPPGAGVRHSVIEHGGIELVADIVVPLADTPGSTCSLAVCHARAKGMQNQSSWPDLFVQTCAKHACEELVEMITFPSTVHVRFAKSETSMG